MGGLSILAYLYFAFFVDKGASVGQIASFAAALAFLVNYPHFMASYYILYKDNAERIFTSITFFWAGVILPLMLFGIFLAIFIFQSGVWLGYMVALMFFTVGWHYVKQIFGCLVVSNVFKTYFYSPFERGIILFNLYSLWWMTWLPGNMFGASYQYYGITYTGLNVSSYLHTFLAKIGIHVDLFSLGKLIMFISIACVAVSLVYIIFFHVARYIEHGTFPHIAGILAFVTLYIWYIPTLSHPSYVYVIPFLHSLQYLAFVRIYRLNAVDEHAATSTNEKERRRKFFLGCTIFIFVTVTLGALLFEVLPKALDAQFGNTSSLGATAYLVSFILFINIHHYFIDNILWKKDNPLVKKYLFAK